MDVVVRRARATDYPVVLGLMKETQDKHIIPLERFFNAPKEDHPFISSEVFELIINDNKTWCLVAESNNDCIGYALVQIHTIKGEDLVKERKFAFIQDIGVNDGARNKGIGRILMNEVKARCVGDGIDCIELDVWEFNLDARKFYEKCGLKTLRRRMILYV